MQRLKQKTKYANVEKYSFVDNCTISKAVNHCSIYNKGVLRLKIVSKSRVMIYNKNF
jgi:hypothetical protein